MENTKAQQNEAFSSYGYLRGDWVPGAKSEFWRQVGGNVRMRKGCLYTIGCH